MVDFPDSPAPSSKSYKKVLIFSQYGSSEQRFALRTGAFAKLKILTKTKTTLVIRKNSVLLLSVFYAAMFQFKIWVLNCTSFTIDLNL